MTKIGKFLAFGGMALTFVGTMLADKAKELKQEEMIEQKVDEALAKREETEEEP